MLATASPLLESMHAAIVAVWGSAEWSWMHGADTPRRTILALAGRVAAHEPGAESGDGAYYAPLGSIVSDADGLTLVWKVEAHASWRSRWGLALEPRLRRRLLWILNSDRIPGRYELQGGTANRITQVLRKLAAQHGASAVTIPSNPHRNRRAVLVFPP